MAIADYFPDSSWARYPDPSTEQIAGPSAPSPASSDTIQSTPGYPQIDSSGKVPANSSHIASLVQASQGKILTPPSLSPENQAELLKEVQKGLTQSQIVPLYLQLR
jgi:hypothetical protein